MNSPDKFKKPKGTNRAYVRLIAVFCWVLSAEAIAAAPSIPVQKLIAKNDALNEKCRGGSGDDPRTIASCKQRDKVSQEILKAGWCWGPDDAPGYQKKWTPCAVQSTNQKPETGASGSLDLERAVATVSKTVRMLPSVKNIKAKSDGSSYSLTVYYSADGDVETDTRLLATAFVQYLVSIGRDPSSATNRRSVHVCGLHDGLTTVSGKPGVKVLGCSHYNPYKDAVSWDGV